MKEGSVAFDGFESHEELVDDPQLWWRALRMIRAGMMPPVEMPPLTDEEKQTLETWIKRSAFHGDPDNPDPGHVTLRRLNRNEYRNTIRDLLGVDYDTPRRLSAGRHGPRFRQHRQRAECVAAAVGKVSCARRGASSPRPCRSPRRKRPNCKSPARSSCQRAAIPTKAKPGPRWLSYYEPAWVSHRVKVEHAGRYQLEVNLSADEKYVDDEFDYNKCRLTFSVDGEGKLNQEFSRQGGKPYQFTYDVDWQPGEHELIFELTPLTPDVKQVRALTMRIKSVVVRGPLGRGIRHSGARLREVLSPPGARQMPTSAEAMLAELLQKFADRAYRRPVDAATIDRLVALAEQFYSQPGNTFETGIAEAMTAVLASPRFLFREEVAAAARRPTKHIPISTITRSRRGSRISCGRRCPTRSCFDSPRRASSARTCRPSSSGCSRILAHEQFIRHFVGQWLRARDIETVIINAREVVQRDAAPDLKAIECVQAISRTCSRSTVRNLPKTRSKEFEEIRRNFRRRSERFDTVRA